MHGTTSTAKAGAGPQHLENSGQLNLSLFSGIPRVSSPSQRGPGDTEVSGMRTRDGAPQPCCLSPTEEAGLSGDPCTAPESKAVGQWEPTTQGEGYIVSFLCFHYNFLSHCFF